MDIEEFKNLTDEEKFEINKKLAAKAVKQFLLLQGAKWIAMFGSIYIAKKILESKIEDQDSTEE